MHSKLTAKCRLIFELFLSDVGLLIRPTHTPLDVCAALLIRDLERLLSAASEPGPIILTWIIMRRLRLHSS